jgi:hypothetical protein
MTEHSEYIALQIGPWAIQIRKFGKLKQLVLHQTDLVMP